MMRGRQCVALAARRPWCRRQILAPARSRTRRASCERPAPVRSADLLRRAPARARAPLLGAFRFEDLTRVPARTSTTRRSA